MPLPPKPPPPHLHKPHEPTPPPHERAKKARPRLIAISVILGTAIAFVIGLALHLFQISINVILPVLAPIWVGVVTLTFTALNQH